ncbi:MAG: helix-turn-helix domain-containing protein [Ruminococcus sp.]
MKDRIKALRERLGKSQDEFGKDLGLTRNYISLIENGQRNLSDQSIKVLCSLYDVNEKWLRTGNGEMFIPKTKNEQINEMLIDVLKCEDSDFKKRLITALSKLDDTGWNALEKFIDSIANQSQEE